MNQDIQFIRQSVIRDMSEGLMIIGLDGRIAGMNPSAAEILGRSADEVVHMPFAAVFLEYDENDAFNQTILDAIYNAGVLHKSIVPYYTGTVTKHLGVTTSYLLDGDKKIAVVAVLSDLSELYELRDAVKAMEKIRALNEQLEMRNKLLSDTFGRFLSDDIVRSLLETPDGLALGGKKRELTVMMSDLRGFTAMSEKMPAQELVSMLNHYLGEMTEIIQKHSGTIIEFIGDGIMAVFGAPVESEISATQAVAAAVEMQTRMTAVNAWNAEKGYPQLEMGIGVNTGDVIVGNIGSEKRTKYGVCGSNVNLCGRIESYTTGGQIIISAATKEQVRAELTVEDTFTVKPKGVEQPIPLYRISGIGAPYHYYCTQQEDVPVPLETPLAVRFYLLDGKHTSDEEKTGSITARSEKEILLKTEEPLAVYDNICLKTQPQVFAKVIRTADSGYTLRITANY